MTKRARPTRAVATEKAITPSSAARAIAKRKAAAEKANRTERVRAHAGADDDGVSKAFVLGGMDGPAQATNRLVTDDEEMLRLGRAGAIAPPYPLAELVARVVESTALKPAIACMRANVVGHGVRFEELFNLKADNANDVIRRSLVLEHMTGGAWGDTLSFSPTDLDVEVRRRRIELRMGLEEMRLNALKSSCCPGSSLDELLDRLDNDLEGTGNAYVGVLRNRGGRVVQFEHLPSVQMRVRPMLRHRNGGLAWVDVRTPVRKTPITIEYEPTPRTFRTYVQLGQMSEVYFAQFGDPRVIGAHNGQLYRTEDDLGRQPRATEVYHLQHPSFDSVYGEPPWIAASAVVSGLRESQESNTDLMRDNCVPRMILCVQGGRLRDGADKVIEKKIQTSAKGRGSITKGLLIIEAVAPTGAANGRVQVHAIPLRQAVPDDGMFQKYELQAAATIWSQWRLPKMLLGLAEDVNRATSQAILKFADEQVFVPSRNRIAAGFNAILAAEDILFWKWVLNSPVTSDPKEVMELIKGFSEAGGATGNDVRAMMTEAFNRPFTPSDQPWGDLPRFVAEAGFRGSAQGASSSGSLGPMSLAKVGKAAPNVEAARVSNPGDLAAYIQKAADAYARSADKQFAIEVELEGGLGLVLPMSTAELDELIERD